MAADVKSLAMKVCPLCTFGGPSVAVVLSHLRLVHSNDPHFVVPCGLEGCATTLKSFSALYSHIYRRHNDFITKRRKDVLLTSQEEHNEANFESLSSAESLNGNF